MLGSGDEIILVAEATTPEDIVYFLGNKFTVSYTQLCVKGIPWEYLQADVQVFVGVVERYPLGDRTWIFLTGEKVLTKV